MKQLIFALLLFTGLANGQGLVNVDYDTKKHEYQGEWSFMPIWSMQDSLTAAALPFTGDSHFRIYANQFQVKMCDSNHVVSPRDYMVMSDKNGDLHAVSVESMSEFNTGSSTMSGTLLQTSYIVPHGLNYTPSQVYVQPKSANAAALSWVTNITSTNFTITFLSVPILGTNNISFNWVAYK